MADELTNGEIRRWLERIEARVTEGQRATDDRLTNLAKSMVPADLWAAEHRAVVDDVKHLQTDTTDALARVEKTSLERRAALTARDDDLEKKIEALRKSIDQKANKRTEWSRQLKITVFTVGGALLAALLGAWVTALLTAKGIR